MIYYVVIDTNVLVSSLLSKNDEAATVQVVKRLLLGEMVPLYSAEIIKEYKEVLHRKKFKFDDEMIDYLINSIIQYGIMINPQPTGEVLIDMKDLPFYEIVLDYQDEDTYLVTGNLKHFPAKPFVVTARQLLNILDRSSNMR